MRLPALSIRWKMTLVYTGLLAVLLATFGVFLYTEVGQLMIGSVNASLTPRFEQILRAAPAITAELADRSSLGGSQQVPTLERFSGPGLFLQVRNQTGQILAASSNLGDIRLPPPTVSRLHPGQVQQDLIRLPVRGLLPEAATTDIPTARFLLRSTLLVDAQHRVVGLLQVAQSLFIVDAVQDQLIDVFLAGIGAALVLAMLIGIWLSGRLLQPIARMTHLAQQIGASGDLSQRLTTTATRRDEVGRLAVTFNTMLERLQAAFVTQQQFVADASHELKTPLTALLGHANVIRRHGGRHPEIAAEALQEIILQAERMRHIVEDLLILAEIGESRGLSLQVVSLHQMVSEVVKELSPLAREKALHLRETVHRSEESMVLGEPDLLKRVVINLVDNALKWTAPGGWVSITTRMQTRGDRQDVVLEIQDSGCGIPPLEVPHLFERWYRMDKARSRTSGGSGLGLAMVRAIVERHGGSVSVESRLGQGSTFRVSLPVWDKGTEERAAN